jgi:hypothetical protein
MMSEELKSFEEIKQISEGGKEFWCRHEICKNRLGMGSGKISRR